MTRFANFLIIFTSICAYFYENENVDFSIHITWMWNIWWPITYNKAPHSFSEAFLYLFPKFKKKNKTLTVVPL